MTKEERIRLRDLNVAVNEGNATPLEIDEYMLLLRKNNSISEGTYAGYQRDKTNQRVIKTAVLIGGAVVLTWILSKLLGED